VSEPAARPRVEWRVVDGILLLDKPAGLTSNRALQRVRRLYRAEKAGHTGSLDPFATGVLPLCFGQATKIAGLLLDATKCYRARLALGRRTATGDCDGAVTETRPVPALNADAVREVLARFVGATEQIPPMYSALKRDGEALYALARRGLEVERAPRAIRIFDLELERLEPEALEFSVRCSKGTYVRTLGEDLAAALGTCGHLAALERTEVGRFAGLAPHPLAELERLAGDEAALDALLLPSDTPLDDHPRVGLDAEAARKFRHGARVAVTELEPRGARGPAAVRVYDEAGRFLGLGALAADGAAVEARRLMCAAGSADSNSK
jgi:tRNA pseudouridine55 synthase